MNQKNKRGGPACVFSNPIWTFINENSAGYLVFCYHLGYVTIGYNNLIVIGKNVSPYFLNLYLKPDMRKIFFASETEKELSEHIL